MDEDKLAEKNGAQRLADAERVIVSGNHCIARQRALIQTLRKKGRDTTFEEQLLAIFVRSQVLHERCCIRLRIELASTAHEEIFSCRKIEPALRDCPSGASLILVAYTERVHAVGEKGRERLSAR